MAAMLKKLSLEAERPAGVSEMAALVKEGGIAALRVGPCCIFLVSYPTAAALSAWLSDSLSERRTPTALS